MTSTDGPDDTNDSPANQSTAAALLTAQSIVIAAFAVASQRLDVIRGAAGAEILQIIGILGIVFIALSFLGSIMYLHAAEFPAGKFAAWEPRLIFNATVFLLILVVYIGLLLVLMIIL